MVSQQRSVLFPQRTSWLRQKIASQVYTTDVSLVQKDTDRDYYMSASEAKVYGLIDEVILPIADSDTSD